MVVGKGGAGRSTVAAALARRSADGGGPHRSPVNESSGRGSAGRAPVGRGRARGRRVLAVDAVGNGGLAEALGLARPSPAGVVTAVGGGLSVLALSTEAALDQYLRMNLKLAVGARNLGPVARILDFVATAAPAVREILAIGKIGHEVRTGVWDRVVVDGPATGHVIELLAAPDALRPLVGRSPLADETVWLSALLGDPAITRAVAVSLPEELVVSETLELAGRLAAETRVSLGPVVLNRLPPPVGRAGRAEARRLVEAGHELAPLVTLAVERHQGSVRQRARLEALGQPVLEIPDDPPDPVAAALAALEAAGW